MIDLTRTYWAIATPTIGSPDFALSDENDNPILFATREAANKELEDDPDFYNDDEFVVEVKIEDGFLKSVDADVDPRKIESLELLTINY